MPVPPVYYPLRFRPVYHARVWGGRRIATCLGRVIPDGPIGESWEVSVHPNGPSVVAGGPLAGRLLADIVAADPEGILGARVAHKYGPRFPLLVKFIDADAAISVQVHPDDAYAAAHGGDGGKAEMWHVLSAVPDAAMIAGLEPGTTRDAFACALVAGDPSAFLHRVPVAVGDTLYVPPGRVHTPLPGLLMLEIQQTSDTTYRLYDWGRFGLDGQPRALHVDDALAVTDWTDIAPGVAHLTPHGSAPNTWSTLVECPYFRVVRGDLRGYITVPADGSFRLLNVVGGTGRLAWSDGELPLSPGDSLLLPAGLGEITLAPAGTLAVVLSGLP
jgi:mannose-6-phosphate isomerase